MRSELRVCLYPCMNPACRPRCLLILSSTFLSLSWTFFSTSATPPSFTLFFFPILCQELFSIFFPVSLHFFPFPYSRLPPATTLLFHALFFTVSHSRPSLLSSLVLFHTLSPPHKVAFLSLISLFPRSFLLLLSCAFEIPFSSLALSLSLLPVLYLAHTYTHTLPHSVILLLSQN